MKSSESFITDPSQLSKEELELVSDYNSDLLDNADEQPEHDLWKPDRAYYGRAGITPPRGYVLLGRRKEMISGQPPYFLKYCDELVRKNARLAHRKHLYVMAGDKQVLFLSTGNWIGSTFSISMCTSDIFAVLYGSFFFGYFFPDGLPNQNPPVLVVEDF